MNFRVLEPSQIPPKPLPAQSARFETSNQSHEAFATDVMKILQTMQNSQQGRFYTFNE